jgi:IS30 family transposase
MSQTDCSTKEFNSKHLTEIQRGQIEVLLKEKMKQKEIANLINKSKSCISREIKRNKVQQLNSGLEKKEFYFADAAQRQYKERREKTGARMRIHTHNALVEQIENLMIENSWSPAAAIGNLEDATGKKVEITIKTMYNIIDSNLSKIKNIDLWEKVGRKPKKKTPKTKQRTIGTSIDERPEEANNRSEFGHWEIDGVLGKKTGKSELVTIIERQTLQYLIIRIPERTQGAVIESLDLLEKKHGKLFTKIFKSITSDNGGEFLDFEGIEKSKYKNRKKRTKQYFAHPYSSWERGSNENANGIIRRFIPKGTDLKTISDEKILWIQNWINNLPRKKLAYKSANAMFQAELSKLTA